LGRLEPRGEVEAPTLRPQNSHHRKGGRNITNAEVKTKSRCTVVRSWCGRGNPPRFIRRRQFFVQKKTLAPTARGKETYFRHKQKKTKKLTEPDHWCTGGTGGRDRRSRNKSAVKTAQKLGENCNPRVWYGKKNKQTRRNTKCHKVQIVRTHTQGTGRRDGGDRWKLQPEKG